MKIRRKTVLILLAILSVSAASAQTIRIPPNTRVYLETLQPLTAKGGQAYAGMMVRCKVWRDVIVDDRVVIQAGAPAMARVATLSRRKVAGIKGKMTIEALEAESVDGRQLQLAGGYNKEGKGRIAMSASLAALVAWPLIFIPGSHAEMPMGAVFDAYTGRTEEVNLAADKRPGVVNLAGFRDQSATIAVNVLYDELGKQAKPKHFFFSITAPTSARSS